jgi:hypothetical protein
MHRALSKWLAGDRQVIGFDQFHGRRANVSDLALEKSRD